MTGSAHARCRDAVASAHDELRRRYPPGPADCWPDARTAHLALTNAGRLPTMYHRDGIPWTAAPIPHRWHQCTAWTAGRGFGPDGPYIERCGCGAIRTQFPVTPWAERNSRRGRRSLRRMTNYRHLALYCLFALALIAIPIIINYVRTSP